MINEKGSNDLEARIEQLEKQKEFLQEKCRQAGARIKELETDNKRLANEVNYSD
jgi:cell division protein FtsB